MKKIFTVKNFAKKNKEQGTWPDSEASIWALRANSSTNGFKDAFFTVNARVLIDEEKFETAIAVIQKNKTT